jgi:hypothetical protein
MNELGRSSPFAEEHQSSKIKGMYWCIWLCVVKIWLWYGGFSISAGEIGILETRKSGQLLDPLQASLCASTGLWLEFKDV